MPVVKIVKRETDLPDPVAIEMDRYIGGRYVAVQDYERYRDAALRLHKRGKIRFSYSKLCSQAERVEDEGLRRRLHWAISNTAYQFWRREIEKAEEQGIEWDKNPNFGGDVFEASLNRYHRNHGESTLEHPAVMLITILDVIG